MSSTQGSTRNRGRKSARRTLALLAGLVLGLPTWLSVGLSVGLPLVATPPAHANPPPAATAPGREVQTFDRWYVLELQGARAGWMNESRRVEGGRVVSENRFNMSIRRGEASIAISMESTFVETPDGEPVSMTSKMGMGAAPIETRYEFGPDAMRVVTLTQGRESESTLPLPEGEWLTPAESTAFVHAMLASGRKEFSVREMSAMEGPSPITSTYRDVAPASVSAMGRTAPAMRATLISSSSPGVPSTVYLNEGGGIIRTEIKMGAIAITMVRADKELALSDVAPPEMMASTLVEPDRRIRNARTSRQATYVLSVPDGSMPELPSAGAQTVERVDDGKVRVTIDIARAMPAQATPEEREAATSASTMIDGNDERIRELARRATSNLAKDASVADRAEALRAAAFKHIRSKGLDVGFASASEACRTGEGDCSEHAVLLAALLRAEGIPSRTVSGLLYVDEFLGKRGVFGYHMWTQALMTVDGEERWVDLDATLPPGVPFDATHVAIATSAMSDGESVNAMAAIAPLLGSLEIHVEKVE
ncbi:MAG: transglutaminase-like domain-containing protein [Phycisphaerales bacterium]|jgi:hypothetical protein|nr:transglutaminase-like domain-containing protein [Phycisphaerales bacterium]